MLNHNLLKIFSAFIYEDLLGAAFKGPESKVGLIKAF